MRETLLQVLFFVTMIVVIGCQSNHSLNDEPLVYPTSFADSSIHEERFGLTVKDPYRWLEHMSSDSTKTWITEENKLSDSYFKRIPYLPTIAKRLRELWNYTRYSTPFIEHGVTYYFKNDGLQKHDVLYRTTREGIDEVLLDPNTFSKDGTVSLTQVSFSSNGKLLAYSISEGGSDWRKVIVMDLYSKEQVGDTLKNIKFSGITWDAEDAGFYYSTYKDVVSKLSETTSLHSLYYHKLNTPQKNDVFVFGGSKNPFRYIYASSTEDRKYLILTGANSTYGNALFIRRLDNPSSPIAPVFTDEKNDFQIIYSEDNHLWLYTDYEAPNHKLVKLSYGKFDPALWETIIPETEMPLRVTTGHNLLFAHYLKDVITSIKQYRLDGTLDHEITLPIMGVAEGFSGNKDDSVLYFNCTSYTTARSIYKYNPDTGESELYKASSLSYSPNDYVSEQVFYASKDSTKIPMIISYKKGIERNGKHPLLLYGYGGFGVSIKPRFSVTNLVWMEREGVLAVPNIRGGGEYGKAWHDAGRQMNKQHVFDDFIAAAEYLIKQKYTSTPYLAIHGRSNGGLLVGACMTQRPDLFRVALPAVGVLDMLRYHYFTAGAGWSHDYGISDQSKPMFEYLLSYSPLHNVSTTCYPATLITTANHDDRVVPAHSYKFAAQLQTHQQCNNPVLIAITSKAGHGAGKPIDVRIEEQAKKWAFTWWNMGFTSLP